MKKKVTILIAVVFGSVCFQALGLSMACADEVYLHNDDRISGKILEQTADSLQLETQDLGTLTIKNESIKKIVASAPVSPATAVESLAMDKKSAEKKWKREFSAGYSLAQGNTDKQRVSGRIFLNRKTKANEIIIKADNLYASTGKKMDTQRFNGMLHYAFNFTPSLRWYNFYRIEGDHDRFANIDYRVTPFTGIGYWFFNGNRLKLMMEMGVGYEYVNYADQQESAQRSVVTPQLFLESGLWGKAKLAQSVSLYLPPENANDYRLHLEAALTNPIDKYWALRLSLIDDFNNFPGGNAKKNDLRLLSSLVYSF